MTSSRATVYFAFNLHPSIKLFISIASQWLLFTHSRRKPIQSRISDEIINSITSGSVIRWVITVLMFSSLFVPVHELYCTKRDWNHLKTNYHETPTRRATNNFEICDTDISNYMCLLLFYMNICSNSLFVHSCVQIQIKYLFFLFELQSIAFHWCICNLCINMINVSEHS